MEGFGFNLRLTLDLEVGTGPPVRCPSYPAQGAGRARPGKRLRAQCGNGGLWTTCCADFWNVGFRLDQQVLPAPILKSLAQGFLGQFIDRFALGLRSGAIKKIRSVYYYLAGTAPMCGVV